MMKRLNLNMSKSHYILILLTLMLFSSVSVSAARRWTVNTHTSAPTWQPTEGRIYIDIEYFDDSGSDVVDYNSGLSPDDGYMNLTFGDTELRITCSSGGGSLNVTRRRGSADWSHSDLGWSGSRKNVRIYWNIKQEQLNAQQTFAFNGKWWHRGATSDDNISGNRTITPTWGRSTFSMTSPVDISNYTDNGTTPVINIPWSKSGSGNLDNYGSIVLCDESGNAIGTSIAGTTSFGASTRSGSFVLNAAETDAINLNQPQTFRIRQTYQIRNLTYTTTSDPVIVRAYPQANEFTAEFNSSNRTIDLKWGIANAPSVNYIEDNFQIKAEKTVNGTTTTQYYDVLIKGGVSSYSHPIEVEEGENCTYSFSLYRVSTKDNSAWTAYYTMKQENISINTIHTLASNLRVELSQDQKSVKIDWDIIGDVWSSGSKVVLSRINLTTSGSEDISLTKDDFNSKTYTDRLIRYCNEYQYKLSVVPNESYGSLTPAYTPNTITPSTIGTIKNVIASKGYYSDRVEINWETEGGFDEFSINRKPYGSPDSEYKQVATVSGSEVQNQYIVKDDIGVPGVIYEYQVKGLINCAGSILEGNQDPGDPPITDVGFRTPTGDIYGRVTYEDGSAVEGVEINVTTEVSIDSKALLFASGVTATVDSVSFLKTNTDVLSLQAWVQPTATTGSQKIISKDGMYELGIENGHSYFKAGSVSVSAGTLNISTSEFTHLSGVYTGNNLLIYINGKLIAEQAISETINGNDNPVELGGGTFAGIIDEVRIWGKALSVEEIERDYNRYLTGGENGLLAYWTFNFATNTDFYDVSFSGTDYNANHGKLNSVTLTSETPTVDQLGYRGVTAADGSYSVRAIPYKGNNTPYNITPRLGIHQFESQTEIRVISAESQNHTVNFIDKSSFRVAGFVTYENSTIPVQGVNFDVDGRTVLHSNGMPVLSEADGSFEIRVPVGIHEVKAVKAGHVFSNEGKITDQNGVDLNYQDAMSGIELKDATTIKYIGRVAGGTIQEAFPIGHSLSTNNLAEGITIKLSIPERGYVFDSRDTIETHFKPSNKNKALVNKVEYGGTDVTIHVNDTTGEFIAYLIPEQFTITVDATAGVFGHSNIPNSGSTIDLSTRFAVQEEVYQYRDSVRTGDNWEYFNYSDTVKYNFAQKFIKRYEPTINVTQFDSRKQPLPYFGTDTTYVTSLLGEVDTIPLWDGTQYTLGMPVFVQHQNYELKMELFEEYIRYDRAGSILGADRVPTQDAKFKFNNDIACVEDKAAEVEADEQGVAFFTFKTGDPELTSAISQMALTVTYGASDNPTSIDWVRPATFANGNAYVLGSHLTGTDFVTAGPDKVLTVLRDPPGSNSYAYLEKGISISESSTYTGSVQNAGTEDFTAGIEAAIITWHGVGSGVINTVMEAQSGATIGIMHEEEYQGQDTKSTTSTFTTRFQTSDDPLYVGPNGDLYIGYSTNISFGTTQNVTVVPIDRYDPLSSTYEVTYEVTPDFALVQMKGLSGSQSFGTLFAYPQVHIEERLIPQLEDIRSGLLLQPSEYSIQDLQATANANDTVFYVSYFPKDSEHYGKSNDDASLKDYLNTYGVKDDAFDGPSYRIIYNNNSSVSDSIVTINQFIAGWEKRMADNEKAKVDAELLQNYSFHAGASVEYNESYSSSDTHEDSFHVMLGGKIANDWTLGTTAAKTKFELNETISTTHGGAFSSGEEASHSKGFVLAESGDDDYISVDVCYEKGKRIEDDNADADNEEQYFSSFIFKTKAGATSCPYEGEYVTKYFEPGKHVINQATMQIEVPEIDMPVKFIENVPSGEPARLQLYLRNNSEIQEDVWFDLKVVDSSNPDGAKMSIDGGAIGNGRAFLVPAGETLIKTLEVAKGAVMNYDDLQLILQSQCQADPTDFLDDIVDTVTFTVHFIPSCTKVNIRRPSNNWTYNTKLPTVQVGGVDRHYMDVLIDQFDVNYDNFFRIEFQYKSASQSDTEWITLMNYYNDPALYDAAIENGLNAEMIDAANAGTIPYRFFMDDLPDQYYDLRAVSVCNVNNNEVYNESEIRSGIKDMYRPRLFGSAQPADGILSVEDEIRLNFNERIAEGLLTRNNFQVRGVRNGSITDHSVSVAFDGINDYMGTEFEKNLGGKDVTVEMWIQPTESQNATLFSHGNTNESLELSITANNYLQVRVGENVITSAETVPFELGSWAHVALVYEASGYVTAYYNYSAVINRNNQAGAYEGIGNVVLGKSIRSNGNNYDGKMHNVRVWERVVTTTNLQLNSLALLSGNEAGLMAYYPMTEGRGSLSEDKARGATMLMSGCEWALPDGFAVATDGSNYLSIEAGSAAITKEMDFTVEFWFKAQPGQTNATMLSNGRGDGISEVSSDYAFSVGFDETGALAFTNNKVKTIVERNDYRDNNWHHFAISVDRTINRGQIYMDGNLTTYIDATNIGGISSPKMYLGARGWYDGGSPTLSVDNYFKGEIDDLRFWELYRNESIVKENNNVKLSGEEFGLIHYYPFDTYVEFQGTEFLEFTNEDMRIAQGPNPETDNFAVVGSGEDAIKSKEIAPLKDFGPVVDLEFDFVVNNDALIINLKEPEYKIAKTIVSLTVTDVRDANGNSTASPITWSAYIDRNQLKWGEEQLNLTKKVFDELEFTVRANNTGGTIRHYTINNLPSWLDATPSSGILQPSSYEEIVFTVNEGLNVGTYDEVIYLTGDDSVSEALNLNLIVTGERPDWSVNPADFKYNMSVMGKMRFNNLFSADKEDMLAAFSNGVCVGVTTSTYNKAFDMWYALLTIYSNEKQANNLEFRMWDASTGKTYKATPDVTINFMNNAVMGTVDEPVIFDGKEIFYQNIQLTKGWNWLSFNLTGDDLSDVNKSLVNGKWTRNDIVKDKNYFDSYSMEKGWTGTLSKNGGFNNTSMFMLLSSQSQVLSTSGTAIDTRTTPISIQGRQWNYIGYLPSVTTTVKEALAGYDAQKGDIVKSQNSFAMYSQNEWVGNLGYLEANKGYMLYRTAANNVTFIYPSVSGALSNLRSATNDNASEKYTNNNFAENMSVVATTENLQVNDRILAYVNDELRGSGEYVFTDEKALSFVTIVGNESNVPVRFDLEREGEVVGSTYSNVVYFANTVTGTIESPVVLNFGSKEGVSVYPNPFHTKFNVDVVANKDSEIEIAVIDIMGRVALMHNEKALSASVHQVVVDGSSLASGIYLVKVTVDGSVSSYKVEKIIK